MAPFARNWLPDEQSENTMSLENVGKFEELDAVSGGAWESPLCTGTGL